MLVWVMTSLVRFAIYHALVFCTAKRKTDSGKYDKTTWHKLRKHNCHLFYKHKRTSRRSKFACKCFKKNFDQAGQCTRIYRYQQCCFPHGRNNSHFRNTRESGLYPCKLRYLESGVFGRVRIGRASLVHWISRKTKIPEQVNIALILPGI